MGNCYFIIYYMIDFTPIDYKPYEYAKSNIFNINIFFHEIINPMRAIGCAHFLELLLRTSSQVGMSFINQKLDGSHIPE